MLKDLHVYKTVLCEYQCCEAINIFMYLRAILCTFQISVDFYFVPEGGRGGGWNVYCMGTISVLTVLAGTVNTLTNS